MKAERYWLGGYCSNPNKKFGDLDQVGGGNIQADLGTEFMGSGTK